MKKPTLNWCDGECKEFSNENLMNASEFYRVTLRVGYEYLIFTTNKDQTRVYLTAVSEPILCSPDYFKDEYGDHDLKKNTNELEYNVAMNDNELKSTIFKRNETDGEYYANNLNTTFSQILNLYNN